MSDPQRELVYAMERLEFGGHWKHKLTLKWAKRWIRHSCKHFCVPRASIVVKTVRGSRAEYDDITHTIELDRKWGQNGLIVLHELAHHITYCKHPRAADHGPTFMLVYAMLLQMARLVPIAGTRAACRRHGVKIARRL